jgi:prepilin-type N-terminal cleavage/methylation domain-containing protein
MNQTTVNSSGNTTNRGFTLIELLIVIAIIGLLSSVVLASLNDARAKSRDVSRKATLRSLQTALELYYSSNGAYPTTGGVWYSSEPGGNQGITNGPSNDGNWVPGLMPLYIKSLPRDPKGGTSLICGPTWSSAYLYLSVDGKNYTLLSHCGPEKSVPSTDTFYDPRRPGSTFKICTTPEANVPPTTCY